MGQFVALVLCDPLDRDSRHHGHYFRHMVFIHDLPVLFDLGLPFLLGLLQFVLQILLVIPKLGGFFVALPLDHFYFFLPDLFELFFEFDHMLRHIDRGNVHTGSSFVQCVDGLVRQEAIGYVAICQAYAGINGIRGVEHIVVLLVALLDVVQDLDRFFDRGRLDHHLLEAAFQCAILFYVLSVFVQGRGANALDLSAGKRWLEHIARIE